MEVQLINKLNDMYRQASEYQQAFETADRPLQQQISIKAKELQQELQALQPAVVNTLSSNDVSDDVINQVTVLYNQISDILLKFPRVDVQMVSSYGARQSQMAQSPREEAMMPPKQMAPSNNNLNENVKNLREQLQNIHKLLNQTQDITEITYEEQQDKLASQDISVMAVNQLKATTKVQNQQLTLEVAQLQRQLAESQAACVELKQRMVDASHEVENLREENKSLKTTCTGLSTAYTSLKTDFQTLTEEKMAIKNKYDVLQGGSQNELEKYQSENMRASQTIAELETENAALIENNNRLKKRIVELEACDVESAAMEVQRAAKTVEALNGVIMDLKEKMQAQKRHHNEVVNSLRTTIAALQEELFGDDIVESEERLPRAKLEEKVQELLHCNEELSCQLQNVQQQSLRASEVRSSLVPQNVGAAGMMESIGLLSGTKQQVRMGNREDDLLNIIKQSQMKK